VFPFSTPGEGGLVSIEIVLLYQGKPLQAATYVSPVRAAGLPGERPTLITFALSGPDEPTENLRPVIANLDGRRSDLVHLGGHGGSVTISDVQDKLDAIEDRVSRVLGVTGAPDSFEDERALALLISLARLGSELTTLLEPLRLENAPSINMLVNPQTPVLPLELAYAGPPPDPQRARLCTHIDEPPPLGEPCDRVTTRIVCPYAFWGLHRSIARTVAAEEDDRGGSSTASGSTSAILYAATAIADDGASSPKPSDTVLMSAEQSFPSVTRVTSWRAWRKAVRTVKPDLLVVLGHTLREGSETRLYIGKSSSIARVDISAALLRTNDSPKPLVLLIACSSAALGDSFGTLPGALTAKGAGAVVGTLSKIVGPQGAAATVHLLEALHEAAGEGSVGDAVAVARYSLVAEKRPIGLLLVSHGELDSLVGA
ncbi:MAG TPA: CHAT domain-containing protein, partial [Solirubrobacterales bacterium]|nr:CHAT domain-containing protein [Solirubrobacterales bacterium]